MINLVCDRCSKTFSGRDEHGAEVKFANHKCAGPDLNTLDFDLLRKVAFGDMTEDQAWAAHVKREAITSEGRVQSS